MMTEIILVALGANLPDASGRPALETCRWAADRLADFAGLRFSALSRWYRTAPVPASDQPDYVNGVARLQGEADAAALLSGLHAIEAQAGRVRDIANAPRVLDLDLLGIGDRVLAGPELVVPHPRLAARAFVLCPLCDVAPDWVHPVLGLTARALLSRVDTTGVRPL